MALTPLTTNTDTQQAVATEIGDTATYQRQIVGAILEEVQALQPNFQGQAGAAVQLKAQQLHEVGVALMQELTNIAERVGVAATGYQGADASGGDAIASSAGVAFH